MKSLQWFILVTSLLWLLCARIAPFEVMATDDFPVRNVDTGLAYASIQDAINANETLNGHTITVDAGTYNVTAVLIKKSVSIIGENKESTILLGSVSYEYVGIFHVRAENVTLAGFTLQDGYWGIALASNSTHVANCTVRNNRSGIVSGINALAGGNTIEDSTISDNEQEGIDLMTSNNTIRGNTISGNRVGINVVSMENDTSGTIISGNTVENNEIGCQIGLSHDNLVFHNNFVNNTVQASSPTGDVNKWDDGYPSGGNYWSNYYGTDADHDGIGDSPYVISTIDKDRYPLMAEYVITEYSIALTITLLTVALLLALTIRKKEETHLRDLVKLA
jgi:parallel beta-helix repeat protein